MVEGVLGEVVEDLLPEGLVEDFRVVLVEQVGDLLADVGGGDGGGG